MRYEAHETLVAPARPTSGLLRLFAGIVITIAVFFFLNTIYLVILSRFFREGDWYQFIEFIGRAETPASVFINLSHFAFLIAALALALRVVHKRGIGSLIGPWPLAIRQFGRVFLYVGALFAVTGLLLLSGAVDLTANLAFATWIKLLPFGLLGILIQTGSEEIAFRGYLQSQLAARFSHPVLWLVLPSVVFAALHYAPAQMGPNAIVPVLWAFLFGIATGDLTARAGTLGPAIALHMVNNATAMLIATPQGRFDGLALYNLPFALDTPGVLIEWMPVEIMMLLCMWLSARLALKR